MTERQKAGAKAAEADQASEDPSTDEAAPALSDEALAAQADGSEQAAADAQPPETPEPSEPAQDEPSGDPEPDGELRAYRAVTALYGRDGLIPAGGLFLARPDSGKARSNSSKLVEDGEQIPAEVAAALKAATES